MIYGRKKHTILIIGNGFDLAHRMKTNFKDYLEWELKRLKEIEYFLMEDYTNDIREELELDYDFEIKPEREKEEIIKQQTSNIVSEKLFEMAIENSNKNLKNINDGALFKNTLLGPTTLPALCKTTSNDCHLDCQSCPPVILVVPKWDAGNATPEIASLTINLLLGANLQSTSLESTLTTAPLS